MAPRRLILVDDHRALLEQVSVLLAEAPGIEVVGRYTNGSKAVEGIVAHQPDVALIDLELPDISGAEVIQRVKARGCPTACLVLTHFDDDTHLFPAMRAGAVGYIVKTPTHSGLLKAIQDVLVLCHS